LPPLRVLAILLLAVLSMHKAFSSDLRWDKVYQVPDDEIWQITWKSPYDSGDVRPLYDLKILSGEYRIPNFKWVQVFEEEELKEIHFLATSKESSATIEVLNGSVFSVANDLLDFKVRPLPKPSIKQRGLEILDSISVSQIVLIGSVLANGLIGWIIGLYVGRPLLGFGLGLPLGPIGWVIVLLMTLTSKKKTQSSTEPHDPSVSFESYKTSQQKTRPAFSHMTTKEQKEEWMYFLESERQERISSSKSPSNIDKKVSSEKIMTDSNNTGGDTVDSESIPTIDERLKKIKQLLEDGLISEEEASIRRSKILEEI